MSSMSRDATERDVPALVEVINRAYRVEDFFIDGDRTDAADVQARMSRPGAGFLVIDGEAPGTLAAAPFKDMHKLKRPAEMVLMSKSLVG